MAFAPESMEGFIQVQVAQGTVPQLCRDISLHTGKDNPPSEGLRESELQEHTGIRTGAILFLHHLCLLASSSHPPALVSIFFFFLLVGI